MQNILIVGHKGFIGSKLLSKLVQRKNFNIICLESDLLNLQELEKELESIEKTDTLIFLVGGFGNDFKNLIDVNLITLNNILNLLLKKDLKNIIFSSTGAVYGDPIKDKSLESDILSPNSIYGLSKIFSEDLLRYYSNNYKLNVTILRFPNVYGAGNRKGVIFNFLKSIKDSEKIIIDGTGEEQRNFLYIDDAIKSFLLILDFYKKNKKNPPLFDIFNISYDKIYTINNLVTILLNSKLKFKVFFSSIPNKNTIKSLSLCSKKFKSRFDWEPKIDLKTGIKKTIKDDFFIL